MSRSRRATPPRRLARAPVGLAGLPLALAVAITGLGLGCARQPGSSVLLIVIDTLRADRLSSYGYVRPTTPAIDAIAERGVRFERVSSTSSWTLPAHASMFTGRYPIEHGATQEHTKLGDALPTLAEILSARGYATFAATGNGVVNPGSGLARGFDEFVATWRDAPEAPAPLDHPNLLAVRRFLDEVGDAPFFAFVNYAEVHGPYTPPEPYRSRFLAGAGPVKGLVARAVEKTAADFYVDRHSISRPEWLVLNALYDGEVGYADALVAALVAELGAAGRLDDTLVIITSDHGENIGDHGHFRHVFSLYDSTVRVPLIVLLPGASGGGVVRTDPASLVDLFPTILAAAGVDPADFPSRGRDLFAETADSPSAIFAEYYYPLQALGLFGTTTSDRYQTAIAPLLRRLRSVEADGHRYIWSSDGREELYDLAADPNELTDLARLPASATRLAQLRALLDRYVEEGGGDRELPEASVQVVPVGAFEDLDAETLERLRELGYLPPAPDAPSPRSTQLPTQESDDGR